MKNISDSNQKNKSANLKRINGRLHLIEPIFNEAGKLISHIIKPLSVEFKWHDVMQIIVGSMILAIPVGFAVQAALGRGPWSYVFYGLATAILVVVALLPNIRRLRAGTERQVRPRARARRPARNAHEL